jgi:hypothetical protein
MFGNADIIVFTEFMFVKEHSFCCFPSRLKQWIHPYVEENARSKQQSAAQVY